MKTKLMALEALKLADKAFEEYDDWINGEKIQPAIAALEADIAKPVEHVAVVDRKEVHGSMCSFINRVPSNRDIPDGTKLYTTPQELVAAGWVSVDDRLPEPWTEVLVYPRPSDYCCEAQMGRAGCETYWEYSEYEAGFGDVKHRCNVTHWMQLPAAPGGAA